MENVTSAHTSSPNEGADAVASVSPAVDNGSPSPLLSHVPGASNEADGRTLNVAWHYGKPLVEQSRITSSKPGLVDRWDRVAILISGEEAAKWLNTLISQKVNAIRPGQATWGLNLDIQGRILQNFGIACLDDSSLLLDVPGEQADALEDHLTKMIFWSQVTVQRLELAQLTVLGEDFSAVGLSGSDQARGDATKSYRTRMLGDLPVTDYWVPRDQLLQRWDELTQRAQPAGLMAYTALRVQAREPEVGFDTDEKTIPHEVPAFIGTDISGATQREDINSGPTAVAVHLNKGCYRGQETVSRVHNLGRSPRVLVLLHLDGSKGSLPDVGASVQAGGKVVGRVGTSVHDADFGPIALGLIKRSVLDKLAKDPSSVPHLTVDGVDTAVDPEDIRIDDSARPGRQAITALRKN